MIHEFIADKKAVEDSDTAAFAAMILATAYPQHRFQLTNNFFYSPIKRRLFMLVKNQNPKVNYLGRLLVLPLAVLIFAAFTFKANPHSIYSGKTITVVIDAGHGGADAGAISADGSVKEKDLNLAIIKKIKELNTNDKIKIVLTREDDSYQSPLDKVTFSKQQNPDLFISFHVDNGPKEMANTKTGVHVWVPNDEFINAAKSKVLASTIISTFSNNYALGVTDPSSQSSKGIMVLKGNTCPAVLIELGYLNNQKDLSFLQTTRAKETIAKNILKAIEVYLVDQSEGRFVNNTSNEGMFRNSDTVPLIKKSKREHENEIREIKELSKGKEEIAYAYKGRNYFFLTGNTDNFWETDPNAPVLISGKLYYTPDDINKLVKRSEVVDITRIEKEEALSQFGISKTVLRITKAGEIPGDLPSSSHLPTAALYILDGVEITAAKAKTLSTNQISSINVLKGKAATNKYGDKAKGGVVEISTKKKDNAGITDCGSFLAKDDQRMNVNFNQVIDTIIIKNINTHINTNVKTDIKTQIHTNINNNINSQIHTDIKPNINLNINSNINIDVKPKIKTDIKLDPDNKAVFTKANR